LPIPAKSNIILKCGFGTGNPALPKIIREHKRNPRMWIWVYFTKGVALLIGTIIDFITFWENGRSQPQIHFYPKIISFLGNYPFNEVDTFSGKLLKYRHLKGLTYKQLGKVVGVDGSTVASREAGKTVPNAGTITYVLDLVQ